MGYYRGTEVSCTNPSLLASGSTFNQEWSDCLIRIESGVTHYHCRKEYLNDAIVELSRQHPDETFTRVTWTDDDFEDCIEFTSIIKNGKEDYINMAPHYQILFPVIDDENYNSLIPRFQEIINQYLSRIDILKADPVEGIVFDFLNDKKDSDGFTSYYTITWENDEHVFKATKRYTSMVVVDYRRKKPLNPESGKDCGIEKSQSENKDFDSLNNNM